MIFNSPFSLPKNQFFGFEYGFYWFHLSSEIPQNSGATFQLNGLEFPVTMLTSEATFPRNRMTIDTLQRVLPSTLLTITAKYTDTCSNQKFETSLLGIRLDNILSPFAAFSARTTFMSCIPGFRSLNFDQVIVDEGNIFVENHSQELKAKQSGTYVFSINVPMTAILLQLTINNQLIISLYEHHERISNMTADYNNRATIMHTLHKNDIVKLEYVKLVGMGQKCSNGTITFTSFLYSLASNKSVAWSLVSKDSWTSYRNSTDYYPFRRMYVNNGSPWQATLNKIIVPLSGIYFVHLTGHVCSSEKDGRHSEMFTLHNGHPIIILRLSNTSIFDCLLSSQSTIVNLTAGDELRVKAQIYGTLSWPWQFESFTGFLLQETS